MYGTKNHTICVWYVPYAYSIKYVYGMNICMYVCSHIFSNESLFIIQLKCIV